MLSINLFLTSFHLCIIQNACEPIHSSKYHVDIISHDFSLTDLGLRQPRLEGEEYLSIVDEFMEAVFTRWPKAIVQVLYLLEL